MNYNYYMPTRVIMGRDCIIRHSDLFRTLGKKALIVTGAHSARMNGSERDVKAALDTAGISYLVFDKIMSNPTISSVYEGALLTREIGADFIIAIGGGSPMDAGKAIALLAAQDIAEENLFSGQYDNKALPTAMVPTTAGTGSEVTQYAILTNDKVQTKTSIASALLFPALAFLDAKYMEDLPVPITINTAIDALSHAVEGMLTIKASVIANTLAGESIRLIMNSVPEMLQAMESGPMAISSETREQLLQASLMAGIVIAQTGTTAVHSMGYSLTYFKNIDHGRANGLLLGEYLKLTENEQPDLIQSILTAMNLSGVSQFKVLMNRLLGEKESISVEEIKQFSQKAIQAKNIANGIFKPDVSDLEQIYRVSFGL